jgi:hypothetical protein
LKPKINVRDQMCSLTIEKRYVVFFRIRFVVAMCIYFLPRQYNKLLILIDFVFVELDID